VELPLQLQGFRIVDASQFPNNRHCLNILV
jgi:hypothetical protein